MSGSSSTTAGEASRSAALAENPRRTLRVFISSPSDVRPERLLARRFVERLNREYQHYFDVEAVLWEREPLRSTAHFQASVPTPSTTDIVVVILWSRLGVKLPADSYRGALSGREVTGTEWEFEEAFAAWQATQQPDMLVYLKTADVNSSLGDEANVLEQLAQRRILQDFLDHWFRAADTGVFKLAHSRFANGAEFEDMLALHLRELVERQAELSIDVGQRGQVRWHRGSPYRGLESFGLEHAPVFFGRTEARNELRELLGRRVAAGCAFVLVMGASGSGKSSLVKAGLLADLQLPGMIGRVAICRHALLRPASASCDMFELFSAALLAEEALPELAALGFDQVTLAQRLRAGPAEAVSTLHQALRLVADTGRLAATAQARLVVVVDQLEEIFTLDKLTPPAREAFIAVLEAFARSGLVWVVATMRSDFFERLASVPALARLSAGEGRYLLQAPTLPELRQIIREPARAAGLVFEFDRERGMGLDDALVEAAGAAPAVLPLLEFTLDQLWGNRTSDRELTFRTYQLLGGLEGALGIRAEEEFARLEPRIQDALPQVLRALATVGEGTRAALAARAVSLASFAAGSPARALVDAFLAPQARLLVAWGDGDDGQVLRVAHEALLSHWHRAREQLQQHRRELQTRTRLEQAANLWHGVDSAERESRLLPAGLPLAEAQDLLARRRGELDDKIVRYVEASISAGAQQQKRQHRRLVVIATMFAILGLVASAAAVWATHQRASAQANAQRIQGLLLVVEKGVTMNQPPALRGHEFTLERFRAVMPGLTSADAALYFPYLQIVMNQFGIDTPPRQAAFLALLADESADLRFKEEPWGPNSFQKKYEPPGALARSLGNTEPGDGKRFRGRGPLQITGRANYRRFSQQIGIDFVADPDRMSAPEIAVLAIAQTWKERGFNQAADEGDLRAIKRRVSGSANRVERLMESYARAKAALGIEGR